MKVNTQFEKIDVKKSRTKKVLVVFAYVLFAILTFVSILSVRAYFTATASRSGEISFGSIEINLLETDQTAITKEEFTSKYLTNITPGSTINFNDITVKNTGTSDAYVLLNLDITIPASTTTNNSQYNLHYNKWYNVSGNEVNDKEFVLNSVEPTRIIPNNSATTNISWTVPGDVVDNKYKTSKMTVNLVAYACQTYLPSSDAYANANLYASYFIVSKASEIATGVIYSGSNPYSDPIRKVGTSLDNYDSSTETLTRNINKIEFTGNEAWTVYQGYPTELEGISYRLSLTDIKIGFQTSFCSHFKNVNEAWKEGYKNDMGIYSDHNSYKYIYFRAPNASVKALETDKTDNFSAALEGFKTWLAEKYANGQPVTLWYQLESPTTQKIYESKNLHSGDQSLRYETEGEENTTTEKGLYSITNTDLLKYLKNKEFTVSALIKHYEEDTSKVVNLKLGFKMTLEYVCSSGNLSSSFSFVTEQLSYDENWTHNWVSNSEILSSISELDLSTLTAINIYLSDYDAVGDNRSFEIKNIQIELGEVPTDFD